MNGSAAISGENTQQHVINYVIDLSMTLSAQSAPAGRQGCHTGATQQAQNGQQIKMKYKNLVQAGKVSFIHRISASM